VTLITGGYRSPLVMGLTPWTKARLDWPSIRTDWPPYQEADRLVRYAEYTALIENAPADVFDDLKLRDDQKTKILIAANLPELLCQVWADAIWSDPPTIELPSTAAEDAWEAIDKANRWTIEGAEESIFGAAFSGHSIVRLFRSEELGAITGSEVQIEEIDPAIYFPILKAGSSRIVESVVLAWEEDRAPIDAPKQDVWQVREIHDVDDGVYQIQKQERKQGGPTSQDPFRNVGGPQIAQGVDFLPIVDLHAKRWRGRYWGVSELHRQLSLVDEIDNTLSNVAEILEYHGKPLLQVPASMIFGGTLMKGADKAMGIRDPAQAPIARYITYDGQIANQLSQLDKLLELAFLTAEVPRTYFGLGLEGGVPSGTSLKLQLQNYLKKAGRWQRKETMRTETLVPMALHLAGGFQREDVVPEVGHGSPLPVDDEQQVRIVAAAVTASLMTQKSGVRVMKRLGYVEDVDDEMNELEAEKEASVARMPQLPPGNDGQPTTRPGQPGQPPAGEQG
jgi:hypothetical protein